MFIWQNQLLSLRNLNLNSCKIHNNNQSILIIQMQSRRCSSFQNWIKISLNLVSWVQHHHCCWLLMSICLHYLWPHQEIRRLVCVYLQVLSGPYRCRRQSLRSLIPQQETHSAGLENEETMLLNLSEINKTRVKTWLEWALNQLTKY